MPKGLTVVCGALFLSIPTLVIVACSGDDGSTFNEGTPDSSTDSPGSFNIDSSSSDGTGGDGTSSVSCMPNIPANYTKQWTPPTQPSQPGPCQTTDIDSYYDQCLATLGQAGGAAACQTWKASHDACGKCIEPANNSGPIQWYDSRLYYTTNLAGCIAIKQNKYGADDCGGAYGASVNCNRDACEACTAGFSTGASTFKDFQNCENIAKTVGLCKSLDTNVGSACGGGVATVQNAPDTKPCFIQTYEDGGKDSAKVFYGRLIGIFCGP